MSDTASHSQLGKDPSEASPREGSSGAGRQPAAEGAPPLLEEQPTVISRRPPAATLPQTKPDSAAKPTDIPLGARLGHLELLEYIGGGGMGRVYRALDTRLRRTVALKVLSRDQSGQLETLMRFRNEARSAARLSHEGIAQVYFVGEDDGLPFIAFEFVEGINIRDLVARQGALPLAEALSYTLQVAEALAHTASQNVVHRDIKPSNVLITSAGRAKLIDMGLARMQKVGDSASDLTASGVTLGTFDYISPEQARDPRIADIRSDIYSLGCTLFFMLTGRPPFPEGTVLQKLLQHQGIEPPDIRELRPDLSEEVSRLIRKMMAKEPRRRFQDASKLIEGLLSLAEQIGVGPLTPGLTPWREAEAPKTSFLRQHVPWMAPIAALVVAVTLLHLLWDSSAQEAAPSLASWVGEPGGMIAMAPRKDEPSSPNAAEPDREAAIPGASEHSTNGAATEKPTAPEAGSKQVTPAPAEPAVPPATNGGAGSPQQAAPETPIDVARPNPLKGLISSGTSGNGLLPDVFEGGVSPSGQSPSGLSVQSPVASEGGTLSGAAGTATELADAGPVADPAAKRNQVLVVAPEGEGENRFATLSSACGAAGRGDVIELRYDGRLEEEPLTLANLELTIRAAEGFQPVVGFRPSEIDPLGFPRSMFTLIGSRLTLTGVAIELDMPREAPSDRWSLFEIGQGERVRFEKCLLTVRNAADQRGAYHQDVAFFRLKAAPGSNVVIQDEPLHAVQPVAIELADCVVRGEAVLLRTEDLRPVDLVWRSGLLVTTEQLLVADGGERAPQPSETIRIDLDHLTAVTDSGLCRLDHREFAPHQALVQIHCAKSALLLPPDASLIEQAGVADVEESQKRIVWRGEDNVYYGFANFWTMRPLDPATSSAPKTFDDWQAYWTSASEKSPRLGTVDQGDLPGPDRPAHSLTPADYAPLAEPTGVDPGKKEEPPVEKVGAGAKRRFSGGPLAVGLSRVSHQPRRFEATAAV